MTDRYRARRLTLPDGEILALRGDGTIERRDAAGAIVEVVAPGDPAWAARAIRFGLHPAPVTVAPRGRYVPDSKPG